VLLGSLIDDLPSYIDTSWPVGAAGC